MNQLPMLIKREFWEHKSTFFYLPLIITSIAIGILVLGAIGVKTGAISGRDSDERYEHQDQGLEQNGSSIEITDDRETSLMAILGPQLVSFSERSLRYKERVMDDVFSGSSFFLLPVLWFVVFLYLMGSLYEDRKDRSILFWKSMPVSDWLTVVSKLVTGLIIVPMVYLAFIAIAHIALLLVASALSIGQPIGLWETLWAPANLFSRWFNIAGFIIFSALWCLPFYGWLLAVSSWCKSVPLAWICGIPVLVIVLEAVFTNSYSVRRFFAEHIVSLNPKAQFDWGESMESAFSLEMLVAIALGAVLISVATWQRGRADEI